MVPIKSVEQQDIQSLHRARELAISHRNAQANQLRGLLLEYGLVVPQGIGKLRQRLPEILEDAENGLSDAARSLLAALGDELVRLDERVREFDRQIKAFSQGVPLHYASARRIRRLGSNANPEALAVKDLR